MFPNSTASRRSLFETMSSEIDIDAYIDAHPTTSTRSVKENIPAVVPEENEPVKKPTANRSESGGESSLHRAFTSSVNAFTRGLKEPPTLPGKFRLVAEKEALEWSIFVVRLGVLADAVSQTILQPNFPFLAREGATPDSFDSTAPFGFSSATYFLPMTAMLGSAITSAFIGSLSDKIGRRPCLLLCVGVSIFGTIAKYLVRESFWTFCIVNFINGLFGGAVPVALAYVSDVHTSRKAKDDEIGILIGFNMIGMSGGGIAAILMENEGLFTPLWIGAAGNFIATILMYFFLLEPDQDKLMFDDDDDGDDEVAPDHLNVVLMSNIVIGSLLDNVGSTGLYPLTLSPLAFETYFTDFLETGMAPLMTASAYKWISVLVVLMVIPGAALSQPVFHKIGASVKEYFVLNCVLF